MSLWVMASVMGVVQPSKPYLVLEVVHLRDCLVLLVSLRA